MKNKIAIFLCSILILGIFSCTKKVESPEAKKKITEEEIILSRR